MENNSNEEKNKQQIQKLQQESKDIVADNLESLKALFPSIFQEGKIDFNKLKQLLGDKVLDSNERYGLFFKGKTEAIDSYLAQSKATLKIGGGGNLATLL